MKFKYKAPTTEVTKLYTEDHLTQFIISSHSVGENEGLAKPGFITDDDEEKAVGVHLTGYEPWIE